MTKSKLGIRFARFYDGKDRIRFRIILSNIFENSGTRLMGLYDSGESGGLPGLAIIMMIENVHKAGKYDSLSIEL